MAFDWGYLIAFAVIFFVASKMYKKNTGKPISELWNNRDKKLLPSMDEGYQRMYITRGIKT